MRVSVGAMLDYVWLSGVAHSVILVSKLPKKKKRKHYLPKYTYDSFRVTARMYIYICVHMMCMIRMMLNCLNL